MERLGQDVRQLGCGSDVDKPHLAVLYHFMREVLPDVDVLGTLSASDDVVAPLNASDVVLVDRSRTWLQIPCSADVSEINLLNSCG